MGKKQRLRTARHCDECGDTAETLFRVKTTMYQGWRFLCGLCQGAAKEQNNDYQYGGTWKQKKRN